MQVYRKSHIKIDLNIRQYFPFCVGTFKIQFHNEVCSLVHLCIVAKSYKSLMYFFFLFEQNCTFMFGLPCDLSLASCFGSSKRWRRKFIGRISIFTWYFFSNKVIAWCPGLGRLFFPLSQERGSYLWNPRSCKNICEFMFLTLFHTSCVYFRFQSPTLALSEHWLQQKILWGCTFSLFAVLLFLVQEFDYTFLSARDVVTVTWEF